MKQTTCAVSQCERDCFASGFCNAHYKRWKRTGSTGSSAVRPIRKGCSVEGCDSKHFGQGFCKTHRYRFVENGDPLVTRPPGSPAGPSNPNWRGDDVAYPAVHRRLRVLQGKARDHLCARCGNRADDWAYQHTANDERVDEKVGLPFTTDLSHYRPMCTPCHRQLDALHGWTRTPNYAKSRGVSFVKKSRKWRAYATLNGRQYHGGCFQTADEAAVAAQRLRNTLLDAHEAAQ